MTFLVMMNYYSGLEQKQGVIKDIIIAGKLKFITKNKSLNNIIGFDDKNSDFYFKVKVLTPSIVYTKKISGKLYHKFLKKMGVEEFEDLVGKKVTCYMNNICPSDINFIMPSE